MSQEFDPATSLLDAFTKGFEDYCNANEKFRDYPIGVEARTIRPSVIVCLGGSGGMTGTLLKKKLTKYFGSYDNHNLQKTSFLLLDTCNYDNLEAPVREWFSKSEYINLGGFNPIEIIHSLKRDKEKNPDLMSWWDDGYKMVSNTEYGASKLRHIGRLCLYVNVNKVSVEIAKAISRAGSLIESQVSMGKVSENQTCNFYILSGSCGGTGSGMLFDVSRLVIKEAVNSGINTPMVNAIVTMPTLHIRMNKITSAKLGDEYEGNAYAFFKELQHFQYPVSNENQRFTSGRQRLLNESMTSSSDRNVDVNFGGEKPVWDNIYLIDNKLPSGEVTGLYDMADIGAEALFHMLVSEIGIGESGTKTTNMFAAKEEIGKYNLPKNFSSFGISHMVFPAEQIAKKAISEYVVRLIEHICRPLIESDIKTAESVAINIMNDDSSGFNIKDLRNSSWGIERTRYERNLEIKKDLEEAFAIKGGGAAYSGLVQAEATMNSTIENANASANEKYLQLLSQNAKKIEQKLNDTIDALSNSASIQITAKCLELIHDAFDSKAKEYLEATNKRSSRTKLNTIKNQIEALSKDMLADKLFQKKHFYSLFSDAEREVKVIYATETASYQDNLARQYCFNVNALVDQALAKLQGIESALMKIRNGFSGIGDQEKTLPVYNTVYVPTGISKAGKLDVTDIVEKMSKNISEDSEKLISGIKNRKLSLIGLQEEDFGTGSTWLKLMRFIAEFILSNETDLTGMLEKDLLDIAREEYNKREIFLKEFVNNKQRSVFLMSEPMLKLDKDDIEGYETFDFIDVGAPNSMVLDKDNTISTDLMKDGNTPKTVEKRRISVLRSKHVFPLYSVSALRTYKQQYVRLRNANVNFHISKAYNEHGFLKDIQPDQNNYTQFALALLSDWLVKQGVVQYAEDHDGGIVYQKGSYYMFAPLDERMPSKTGAHVILRETQRGNRMIAMKVFQNLKTQFSIDKFLENFNLKVAMEEAKKHIENYLEVLRVESNDKAQKELDGLLAEQLNNEREALVEWNKAR